jgi:hypothetical protein
LKRVFAILFALSFTACFADDVVRPSRVSQTGNNDDIVRPSRLSGAGNLDDYQPRTESRKPSATQSRSGAVRGASDTQTRSASERVSTGGVERSATPRNNSNVRVRPSVAEVGGRAIIGRTNTMTGSNIDEEVERKLTRRTRAAENPFETKVKEEEAAPSAAGDLAGCTTSYFDCLNQFCNVLDANQKQCSCSSRLTQYKDVENSLNKANEELNNVAQQIRYVGLSADEVRSIMAETEAETVLSSTTDNSQSRNLLDEIEKIIKSPDTNFSTNSSGSGSNMDFELDFSGDASSTDLTGMFGGKSDSFSNMRGIELYAAAKKKCNSVLTRCASKKADQQIISSQYDIEIDKACVSYEAGLKKATQGVKTNVRSATQMLQKARLAVLSDQNTYDSKACVSALDTCMRDDMVCGSNYYKCLDPTKTAIDENGEIIPGGDVVTIKDLTTNYSATEISDSYLLSPIAPTCTGTSRDRTGKCIIYYLLNKIGSSDPATGRVTSGFCRTVLDKCRRYTYNDNKEYIANNTIVKSYLERTMTQIRAAQSGIISEHASECIHDVSTCYNSQLTQVNSYSGGLSLSPSTVKPILMGACRNVALSCSYAVFSTDTDRTANTLIDKLSEMFYQSMLCPANSRWNNSAPVGQIAAPNYTMSTGTTYVNSNCQCNSGYVVYNGLCTMTPVCPSNSTTTDVRTTVAGTTTTKGIPVPYCQCNYVGVVPVGGVCPTS